MDNWRIFWITAFFAGVIIGIIGGMHLKVDSYVRDAQERFIAGINEKTDRGLLYCYIYPQDVAYSIPANWKTRTNISEFYIENMYPPR